MDYRKKLTNIENNKEDKSLFIEYVLGVFDSHGFDFDAVEFYHRVGLVFSIRLVSIVFKNVVYHTHYIINDDGNNISRIVTYNPEDIDYNDLEIETVLKSIMKSYERKRKIENIS